MVSRLSRRDLHGALLDWRFETNHRIKAASRSLMEVMQDNDGRLSIRVHAHLDEPEFDILVFYMRQPAADLLTKCPQGGEDGPEFIAFA